MLFGLLMPGLGHLMVGNVPRAIGLFLTALLALAGSISMHLLGLEHPAWLLTRLWVLVIIVSAADAAFLAVERRDARSWPDDQSPRWIGFLNLATYGVGWWRIGETSWALIALLGGIGLHVTLPFLGAGFAVLGEIGVAALAVLSFRSAHEVLSPGPRPTAGASHLKTPKRADNTPSWVLPAIGVLSGAGIVLALGCQYLLGNVSRSLIVDQDRALVLAPYYLNPEYDLHLEMNAPGWSFGSPNYDDFVAARHVAEDVQMRLSVRPRWPGTDRNVEATERALRHALERGYVLEIQESQSIEIDDRKGFQVLAAGRRDQTPRRVLITSVSRGWRQFVLWFEWGPDHESFARTEFRYLLGTLDLDGRVATARKRAVQAR